MAVVTDVYSPSAIENEPASIPAMPLSTTAWVFAAAATPAISAVLLTSPSIAPNVAARSQPPDDVAMGVVELMRQTGVRRRHDDN